MIWLPDGRKVEISRDVKFLTLLEILRKLIKVESRVPQRTLTISIDKDKR